MIVMLRGLLMEEQDSFSIGSAASGVNIKVHFEDIRSEVAKAKIAEAIQQWKNAYVVSGRVK